MNKAVGLKSGDIVRRRKGWVWHWGVYLGSDRVLHNTPEKGEHVSSLEDFAAEKPVERFSVREIDRSAILARAATVAANPKEYSYLWRNCEHTVLSMYQNEERSPTVEAAVAFLLLLAGVIAFTRPR